MTADELIEKATTAATLAHLAAHRPDIADPERVAAADWRSFEPEVRAALSAISLPLETLAVLVRRPVDISGKMMLD